MSRKSEMRSAKIAHQWGNFRWCRADAADIIVIGGPDWRAVDQIPVEREPGDGFG